MKLDKTEVHLVYIFIGCIALIVWALQGLW